MQSEQTELTPAYWKRLFSSDLAKELGEILTTHGRSVIQEGEIRKWKQAHYQDYWEAVSEAFKTHFGKIQGKNEEKAIFHKALAQVLETRLETVKKRLILPLYTRELRESVFAWFHLTAPAFYVVSAAADMIWSASDKHSLHICRQQTC